MSTTEKFAGLWYDKGGAVYNVQHPDFGAVGDGSTDDTAAISAAFTAANSAGMVYIPTGTYLIGSDVTFTGHVQFGPGAKLSINSGVTVTFAASSSIDAGRWQIFSGDGDVSAAEIPCYMDWFWDRTGAEVDDALTAAMSATRTVLLWPGEEYALASGVTTQQAAQRIITPYGGNTTRNIARIRYTFSTGNVLTLAHNECEVSGIGFEHSSGDPGGTEVVIRINDGINRCTIRDVALHDCNKGVQDDGFSNLYSNIDLNNYNTGIEFVGGAALGLYAVEARGGQDNSVAILGTATSAIDTLFISGLIFDGNSGGTGSVGVKITGEVRSLVLSGCHFEASTRCDIEITDSNPNITVIGGRLGGPQPSASKEQETVILVSGNRLILVGVTFQNNSEGHIDNPSGATTVLIGCNGITDSQIEGAGQVIWMDDSGTIRFPILTNSNRGSAGTAGRVFFNSDDGQLNVDDGTNWTLPDGTTT